MVSYTTRVAQTFWLVNKLESPPIHNAPRQLDPLLALKTEKVCGLQPRNDASATSPPIAGCESEGFIMDKQEASQSRPGSFIVTASFFAMRSCENSDVDGGRLCLWSEERMMPSSGSIGKFCQTKTICTGMMRHQNDHACSEDREWRQTRSNSYPTQERQPRTVGRLPCTDPGGLDRENTRICMCRIDKPTKYQCTICNDRFG